MTAEPSNTTGCIAAVIIAAVIILPVAWMVLQLASLYATCGFIP